MAALDYESAVAALERALRFGINPTLERVSALCDALGRPQDAFDCIQVAGTNGKTSTARLLAAAIRSQGRRVALYTSPHLERYPERMEIDGDIVSDEDFAEAVSAALAAASAIAGEPVTEFELLTAAALWLFRERAVEVAVLEVGLGGRWDATTVVDPKVAVITGIGLDHTAILGDTLEKIAAEKAGIIKRGSRVVLGPGCEPVDRVLLKRALELECPLVAVREVGHVSPRPEAATVRFESAIGDGGTRVRVLGLSTAFEVSLAVPSYQAPNVATAVAAAEALLGDLDAEPLAAALAATRFPGRFEEVASDPRVVLDGAHNPQAAAVLAQAIAERFERPPLVVLGVLADKDVEGIVGALASAASGFIATEPPTERALAATRLAAIVAHTTGAPCPVYARAENALEAAERSARALHVCGVVVTGSLYTVGSVRSTIRGARRIG